jgi:Zn-dependent protease
MGDVFLIFAAALAILLLFFWSSFRERQRVFRQVMEEIDETGTPAGPLPGPAPTPRAVFTFQLGAAGLFPLVGLPFGAAALVLGPAVRREAGDAPRLRPSFDLVKAATAFAVGGMLVSVAVIAHLVAGAGPFRPTPLLPDPMIQTEGSPFSPVTIATAVVVLVFSAVFHECAHGLAAYWSGDDTARKAGRLTLNPIPHLDLFGSFLLPLMLVLMKASFVIGWAKPVPVRLERLRDRRWGAAAVSSAGVATNLVGVLLFFALFVLFGILVQRITPLRIENYTSILQEASVAGYGVHPLAVVAQALKFGVFINLALALFNLLPFPPLDGAGLLESLLPGSFAPLFAAVRSLGCLLLPLILLLAVCLLLPLLIPAAWALVHVLGAFFVRM